jgi:excisionase family DNA binding protein
MQLSADTGGPGLDPQTTRFDLDRLVDEVATRVAAELSKRIASEASSPWMAMEDAIAYTRVPARTFRKWVAAGRIPAHGGRRKLFHRAELDAALGYEPPRPARAGMPPATTSAPRNGSRWDAQPRRSSSPPAASRRAGAG